MIEMRRGDACRAPAGGRSSSEGSASAMRGLMDWDFRRLCKLGLLFGKDWLVGLSSLPGLPRVWPEVLAGEPESPLCSAVLPHASLPTANLFSAPAGPGIVSTQNLSIRAI